MKGLISAIPFVGSPLIGALEEFSNSRLNDTIEQLSIKVEALGEDKVDIEYVKTEEFIDLFLRGLRSRLQSRSTKKAKFILGLLTESLKKDRDASFSIALKESFLSVLDQLTDEEMAFLYNFSQGNFKNKSKDNIYQTGDSEGVAMDTLIAKGILRTDSSWAQHVVESMFGREFIRYLNFLSKEDSSLVEVLPTGALES